MEGRPVTLEMVRQVAQTLCEGDKTVSNHQIFAALALDCEPEKARARSRISNMVKHGEMTREADGLYRYNFAKRPRNPKTYAIIWRFIRKAKPGWSITECSMMTRVSYTQALRYCNWLEEEGFIARAGRDDRNAITWRATVMADRTPETPYPPLRETDPFAREKAAVVRIVDLLLRAYPYSVKTARGITEACKVLLARFDKNRTENENNNPEEDATC